MSGGLKRDLSSLPRNWTWAAWMKTRNPSCQSIRGWRLETRFPWLLPPLKNAFLKEANTIKTGTKFTISTVDTAQVGEHTEKQFVSLRQKQGRNTHLEKKGCGHPPLMRRNTVKNRLNHLYRAVLPGLCLPLANYLVSFSTPALP